MYDLINGMNEVRLFKLRGEKRTNQWEKRVDRKWICSLERNNLLIKLIDQWEQVEEEEK